MARKPGGMPKAGDGEVGMVTPDSDPHVAETRWSYDPHIDPALQFDVGRAQIEKLIDDALASGDDKRMRAALEQLKRQAAPYLNWGARPSAPALRWTRFHCTSTSASTRRRSSPRCAST